MLPRHCKRAKEKLGRVLDSHIIKKIGARRVHAPAVLRFIVTFGSNGKLLDVTLAKCKKYDLIYSYPRFSVVHLFSYILLW